MKPEPQLVIVLQNTTLSAAMREILSEKMEALCVSLTLAGHTVDAYVHVVSEPAPVYGGPSSTTTVVLCAADAPRKPVQEV